ncbi:hypothetical protein [Mycobacteroides abscessus]|uniref:hypothetical protein n=1 Tax=Mycobacteroides abscessus TaxID=36809 RepID=UPI00092CA7CC|nr:hypothetical protein [Mycobacteroides abscessus]QSN49761.1 hypothetical protein I3U33_26900 [Mycobacteroides abscessus subsp. abscessus]SII83795.1 Uncharacterised protein [Mycobacteroides abscessus subsp. abscessus]SIK57302.1 Uncharacterised protein [Mycobacteroides abscessus subsp. abscessus]SIL84195.1 Uncharacterised protein [Mycobacteroides abscessus subsp. abscessus]SIM12531.1 Uncharacterised protein [Mycobacteroides abscessus subsp. abscessus]
MIKQVQLWHVERHARSAINCRLGYAEPNAVIGLEREAGGTVLLHVNSGGNALAAQSLLQSLGYSVEKTDYDPFAPGHYGVQLRIGPGAPPERCTGSRTLPAYVCLDIAGYALRRGVCASCGRDIAVLRDGTLQAHKASGGIATAYNDVARKRGDCNVDGDPEMGSPGHDGPGRKVPSQDIRSRVSASRDCNGADRQQVSNAIDANGWGS